jgi:hypothetical protein
MGGTCGGCGAQCTVETAIWEFDVDINIVMMKILIRIFIIIATHPTEPHRGV